MHVCVCIRLHTYDVLLLLFFCSSTVVLYVITRGNDGKIHGHYIRVFAFVYMQFYASQNTCN